MPLSNEGRPIQLKVFVKATAGESLDAPIQWRKANSENEKKLREDLIESRCPYPMKEGQFNVSADEVKNNYLSRCPYPMKEGQFKPKCLEVIQ